MTLTMTAPGLEQEGRALVERLGGHWSQRSGLCRCPAHDDSRPSLSVRVGRSRLLLHCFAGCTASEILRALHRSGAIEPRPGCSCPSAAPPAADPFSPAALRVWGGGRCLAGTPADDYLAGRGIRTPSEELRYHPRAPHGARPLTRFRPAMLAAVRDEGGLVAVHRTFLDPRRATLADMAEPRLALGRLGRGAVRLGGPAARLGLAEGVETALSASILFGLPCWATLGTERFGLIALPAEVKELVLFLDNDPGGRRAERLARDAYAHLPTIEAHYPPRVGDDWNDVLRAKSAAARP
ncbi:MAG: virulence protein [Alphaproteobacteria bacterium]|nr:MAG: virulence protein [Alphaproteobacteria bacterium]